MPDEPILISTTRLWRWLILGAVVIGAIALYFRDGRRLQSLEAGANPVVSDSR